jgi:hypothetical protein
MWFGTLRMKKESEVSATRFGRKTSEDGLGLGLAWRLSDLQVFGVRIALKS